VRRKEALQSELTSPGYLELLGAELAGSQQRRTAEVGEQALPWTNLGVDRVLHYGYENVVRAHSACGSGTEIAVVLTEWKRR
jgi:hypothetical protein